MTQPPLTKSHNLLCILSLTKTCFLNPLPFGLIALVRAALSVLPCPGEFVIFCQIVLGCQIVRLCWVLTISAHAGGDAFLEATVLAPVPVHSLDGALLVLCAWSVLDLLLDRPPEESLKNYALDIHMTRLLVSEESGLL